MTPAKLPRALFIVCTIAFIAGSVRILSHRSDVPVIFGRYSAALVAALLTAIVAYAVVAYLYFVGWRRFGHAYTVIASNLLSIVLLLTLINVGAHVLTYFTGSAITADPNAEAVAEEERVHAELIGLTEAEYRSFRSEQGRRQNFVYEPWTGFKETPRQGRYINVSADGFRQTSGSPAEPDHWVFLFGGSTTFGYGVADNQTIASYLQARLAEVYGSNTFGVRNYGRAYHFSSQELLVLSTLLRQGLRPSVAIFVDGANERQQEPDYVNEMREMFSRYQDEVEGDLPLGRLLADLAVQAPIYPYLRRLSGAPARPAGAKRVPPDATASQIAQRYEANIEDIRLLCERYGVVPFFVVQPLPGYRNEHKTHVFLREPVPQAILEVLALMEASTANSRPHRVNLTGLLDGYRKQPFVDPLHYTPEVHKMIAHRIVDGVHLH